MKKIHINPILPVLIFLSSCSISKKINRPAKNYLLNNEALISAHTGISIYEPMTGKYWYNYQAEKYFVPASNTKLATCYSAMKYLGDSLIGIKYNIINDSTVVVEGAGDPTFLHSDFKNQPVYNFLKKFKSVQIINPNFNDFLGNGWSWSDYKEDYMAQRSSFPIYGDVVKINLVNNEVSLVPSFFKNHSVVVENLSSGFRVEKPWEKNEFSFFKGREKSADVPFTPDENTIRELLQDTLHQAVTILENSSSKPAKVIYSQPTDSLLKVTMHRSDNFFAEQALLMVSNKLLGVMDERKIIDTLLKTDFKLMPQKPGWADGSGLSRYDLFSPKDFIFILNKMKDEFGMERIKTILPTGGTGTISSYYRADSGYIFVKTGTLYGVVALSGFLYTKKNKLLIFSVLVNNHRSSATSIRKAIEKFIREIRERN
jgi:D-alanyl-D-alanine carboxypeptidase/D-alanyl-D-alanine-endopeptidase (penicillin-binding protein 4)